MWGGLCIVCLNEPAMSLCAVVMIKCSIAIDWADQLGCGRERFDQV